MKALLVFLTVREGVAQEEEVVGGVVVEVGEEVGAVVEAGTVQTTPGQSEVIQAQLVTPEGQAELIPLTQEESFSHPHNSVLLVQLLQVVLEEQAA